MGVPRHIEALLDPESYPERPDRVELRQTHISYLFFTPQFVYKIKKPVNFGFLDFTTLEKRLFYCNEEVRLNRRLAPDVYLGVVGITFEAGRAYVGGEGPPSEYAVKMKRLPPDTMLEHGIEGGTVTGDVVRRIARAIAAFHKKAETNPYISGFGSPDVIRKNTGENFSQTEDFVGATISPRLFNGIKACTERFIEENTALFERRMEEGFIRDCHGDIHSEHISVADGVEIIDCIEFNERFRFSDTIADIAFLSMDLDFHNRGDLSRVLEESYIEASGDEEGRKLINFYKCYRAYVRGKVEGFKSREAEVTEKERELAELNAIRHFHLAGLYSRGSFSPTALIIRGLSGTGKTTLARALSEAFRLLILSTDVVRKELAGLKPHEHRYEGFKKGIYSEEFTERTYEALIEKGAAFIRSGRSVILDATFAKAGHINLAKEAFAGAGLKEGSVHIIECVAEDEKVKDNFLKRLKEEGEEGRAVSDAGWEIYLEQKRSFEPLPEEHLKADMSRPLPEVVMELSRKIFG